MLPMTRRVLFLCAAVCVLAPLSASQPDQPHAGQAPYDRACKVCHGAEGRGNAAPALVPFSMDAEELLIRVREGGGEMPPIAENRVSDEEVHSIAAYLTSLKPSSDSSGAALMPDLPPR
jgi:mono/diheme cytochrome c family protein